MGWKYATETQTTEVERRTTETLDDQLRFLREWQERARESMRKLSFSGRPGAAAFIPSSLPNGEKERGGSAAS